MKKSIKMGLKEFNKSNYLPKMYHHAPSTIIYFDGKLKRMRISVGNLMSFQCFLSFNSFRFEQFGNYLHQKLDIESKKKKLPSHFTQKSPKNGENITKKRIKK